jgi:prepilin-type processing-associated H-X9-DG protein
MRAKSIFTKKDLFIILACIVFLLMNIGAIGSGNRKRAKEIICLSNLHQWGHIFSMYVEDNDGKFPSGVNREGFWWIVQLEEQYQSYKKNPMWFCPKAKSPIVDENGVTAPSINIFNAWGIYTRHSYFRICTDGISGSYGLNGYILSAEPGTTFEGGRRTDNYWRTPDVKGADNIPLFLESLRFDLWPLITDAPAYNEFAGWSSSNHMARCCTNRHNGAINSLFVDFSARKVGLKELWTFKWHRTFDTAGPWTTAGGVIMWDWPEWMRNFKDF